MRDRDLLHLYPPFRLLVVSHDDLWRQGWAQFPMGTFEGLRVHDRQAELYAIGREVDGEPCTHNGVIRPLGSCAIHPRGKRVTNAPAGFSWHQYGLAVDKVFDADPRKPDLQATWDPSKPWAALGKTGQSVGMEWAGAWRSFPEAPHFQKTYGLQIQEAAELFRHGGGLKAVWEVMDEMLKLAA